MDKTFRYRKHIKAMYKFLLFVDLPLTAIITIGGFALYPEYGIFWLFLLLYSVLMIFFYKRLVTTEVRMTDEEFTYGNHKRKITLKYEQILKIDSKSIRYTGGWLLIHSALNKPIRLTLVIKDIGDMIIHLKERMDAHGLSDRYDYQKLFAFFRTATYGDQSWGRARFFMPKYFATLILHAVLTVFLSIYLPTPDIALGMFAATVVLGMIPFLYVEYGIYAKEYKKMPDDGNWIILTPDVTLDRQRLTRAYLVYLVLAIISLALPLFLI